MLDKYVQILIPFSPCHIIVPARIEKTFVGGYKALLSKEVVSQFHLEEWLSLFEKGVVYRMQFGVEAEEKESVMVKGRIDGCDEVLDELRLFVTFVKFDEILEPYFTS